MRRLGLLAGVVALSAGALGQQAAVPPDLANARRDVKELEERLKKLEEVQSGLGRDRERLALEVRVAAGHVREAEVEQREASQAVAAAAKASEASQAELEAAVQRLRFQLSLLAALGRAGLAPLVVEAIGSGNDITRRVTVALAVFREEKRRRDDAAALMGRREATLSELSARREELSTTAARLAERQRELEETKARVELRLAAIEKERRQSASALAGAQEAEERLERLWGVVTQEEASLGSEVRLLRGGLRWPVGEMRILRRFGPQRDPQYGTVTVSHGAVLAAVPGEHALAVASGRVSFAQFFKGYGNLVIVQHSGEIYSLYAKLASMLVRPGQRVGIGDPVGIVGRDEDGGGSVYLEIRVGQQAQDPLTWLKPAGK
ncbi:MAG: peptidoglycan DD-metalloendopeptidase family protein [Thermoanaerobaculaceae bacterium]